MARRPVKKLLFCLLIAALTALLILRNRQVPEPLVPPPTCPELTRLLDAAGENPALAGAAIGICILNAEGAVLFERNSHTSFIPASTLKTVTTATVLEKWGPDFRIETKLLGTMPIKDGVLAGDVIIQGGADPMLSLADVESWAQTLLGQGLRHVTGRIVGDGRLLPGSLYDDFWNWGDIGNGYGSGVSGLNLEHNRFTARFRPGTEVGKPAEFLGAHPEVPGVHWINDVLTGAADSGDGVVIHGGERTGVMHLRGTVPLGGREFAVTGAVPDPTLYAAHHLRAALVRAGVTVDGAAATWASQDKPAAGEVLVKHQSPRLIEIITSIHATSDNHETECLYRLLGLGAGLPADVVVREHWKGRGLVFEGLRMEDGCGLARADFIRPLDLARLQHFAGAGPLGGLYRESLLATEDGAVRWKGGAMSGVRSYTGFVKTASGAEVTFALMVNHFEGPQAVSALREAVISALRDL